MAKFSGVIGFVFNEGTSQDVWEEVPVEKKYIGDVKQIHSRWTNAQTINDDITLQNEFSIIADRYALQNAPFIRYIEYMGTKWKVTSIDEQRPRLVLSVGGVYK